MRGLLPSVLVGFKIRTRMEDRSEEMWEREDKVDEEGGRGSVGTLRECRSSPKEAEEKRGVNSDRKEGNSARIITIRRSEAMEDVGAG